MTGLTTEQLDRYNSKGYISPINALSSFEAKEVQSVSPFQTSQSHQTDA